MTKQGKRIIFILGIILLIIPLNWSVTHFKYAKAKAAPYHREITATVTDVSKVISRSPYEDDIGDNRNTQYAYTTVEVYETELGVQEYKGYYSTQYNIGDTITHTAYRYENDPGWTIEVMDEQDILIKGVACLMLGIAGIAIMIAVIRMGR